MAISTIFEKLPASGEKCLVIGNREGLVYPIGDEFSDWTELRIGAFFSATSELDNNGLFSTETISFASGLNQVFWGLKDSSLNGLPSYSSTGVFIGTASSSSITIEADGRIGDNMVAQISNGTKAFFAGSIWSFGRLALPAANLSTGIDAFSKPNILRIVIKNKGTTDQSVLIYGGYGNGTNTSNVSTVNLRSQISNTSFSTPATGMFTQDFQPGNPPLPIPDSVFFYFPFLQNRIRIHNLVVEKYL